MGFGLQHLDLGIGIAVFAVICWWMISLTTKSRTQRKQELAPRKIAHQPWGDDKAGGRGNR